MMSNLEIRVLNKINFLISHSKHMLLVLKRTVSVKRFFLAPMFYPFMPYGISLSYQMDHSISVLMVVGWYFYFCIQIFREHFHG